MPNNTKTSLRRRKRNLRRLSEHTIRKRNLHNLTRRFIRLRGPTKEGASRGAGEEISFSTDAHSEGGVRIFQPWDKAE